MPRRSTITINTTTSTMPCSSRHGRGVRRCLRKVNCTDSPSSRNITQDDVLRQRYLRLLRTVGRNPTYSKRNINPANACPCRCVATRSHNVPVLVKVGENQPTSRDIRLLVFSTICERISSTSPYHLDS